MSIRKIAEMTGLSITTVSHAINGTRAVSEKSKKLIQQAIKQTGYKPNFAAQMLKTNKSYIIAFIIPATEPDNSTNCFFFDVMEGARKKLEENGYSLMVATYSENEKCNHLNQLMLLKKQLVDGILFVPYKRQPGEKYMQSLDMLDLPIVLIDRRIEGAKCPVVFADNLGGVNEAIKLLAKQGRSRIGFLSGNTGISTFYDRYQGYCSALQELNLPLDEKLIKTCNEFKIRVGYKMTEELVEQEVDAIFASNNVILMGVFQYLQEKGICIPEDIAVIGFDDYDWMRITTPPITAVYQSPYLLGETGADLLLRTINGEKIMEKQITIPCKLHIRKSHGTEA